MNRSLGQSKIGNRKPKIEMAEGVRFELTRPFGLPVFKTGAINRSATPPGLSAVGNSFTPVLHYSKSNHALALGLVEYWGSGVIEKK